MKVSFYIISYYTLASCGIKDDKTLCIETEHFKKRQRGIATKIVHKFNSSRIFLFFIVKTVLDA